MYFNNGIRHICVTVTLIFSQLYVIYIKTLGGQSCQRDSIISGAAILITCWRNAVILQIQSLFYKCLMMIWQKQLSNMATLSIKNKKKFELIKLLELRRGGNILLPTIPPFQLSKMSSNLLQRKSEPLNKLLIE